MIENAISRRAATKVLLGAMASGAAAGSWRPAHAQSAAHSFKVGAAEVTVLSDGDMTLPPSLMLPGRPAAEIETAFKAAGQTFTEFKAAINVVVIRSGGETILVDAGGGPDFMPTLGKLAERLPAAGIAPESVTRVIFTHAHPDHFWGTIDPLGDGSLFETAKHVMSAAEFEFWIAPDVESKVGENFKGMAAGTHRRLKPMADKITRAKPGEEVAPGVSLVDTAGHTPGHVSVLLKSGSDQLLIGGDALSQAVISFANPDWRWGPDSDPDLAIKTRRRLLDQLATEKTQLIGYHLPWPGVGKVERKDNAYRFVPA